MEYRGIEFTIVQDEHGNWLWSVALGSLGKIKSGQAAAKGTAILKVWAAIDRVLRLPKKTAMKGTTRSRSASKMAVSDTKV
jgi:hypothetical protein